MTIEITEEERDLLLQTVNITNYPGQIAEQVAAIKAKLAPQEGEGQAG